MEDIKQKAGQLLNNFKGENYTYGLEVIDELAGQVTSHGKKVLVVADRIDQEWAKSTLQEVEKNFKSKKQAITGEFIAGARPNAPREDVFSIAKAISENKPEVVLSIGGGSTIDATKAANAYSIPGNRHPHLIATKGEYLISPL
jgi:alcohol dehydrogenase